MNAIEADRPARAIDGLMLGHAKEIAVRPWDGGLMVRRATNAAPVPGAEDWKNASADSSGV